MRTSRVVWISRQSGITNARFDFDENALLELLNGLVKELQRRKGMFRANDSPNLDEYNKACKGTSSPVMSSGDTGMRTRGYPAVSNHTGQHHCS